MTFLTLRSPRGGKLLSDIWAGTGISDNVNIDPESKPIEHDDYLCWKMGYAERDIKKGEPVYVRRSCVKELHKMFKMYNY